MTRERKTVRHNSLAGLDVKGKRTADTEFIYNKQDEDDEDEEEALDVAPDAALHFLQGPRVCKQGRVQRNEDDFVARESRPSRLPLPGAPSSRSSSLPAAVKDRDDALATMLANIANYTFSSTSPFQPDLPLFGDGKVQCPVCAGRFVPKQGTTMRQHQDVQYGGICRGSGVAIEERV